MGEKVAGCSWQGQAHLSASPESISHLTQTCHLLLAFSAAGGYSNSRTLGGSAMLRLLGESTPLCDGVSRREFLRAGGLGLAGLTLPGLLAARAQTPAARRTRARSVIQL